MLTDCGQFCWEEGGGRERRRKRGKLGRQMVGVLGAPEGWRPKISRCVFLLSPRISFVLLSLGGVFSWNCGRGSRPWPTQSARLGSPQSVRRRGSHKMTTEKPKRALWLGHGLEPATSPREDRQRLFDSDTKDPTNTGQALCTLPRTRREDGS